MRHLQPDFRRIFVARVLLHPSGGHDLRRLPLDPDPAHAHQTSDEHRRQEPEVQIWRIVVQRRRRRYRKVERVVCLDHDVADVNVTARSNCQPIKTTHYVIMFETVDNTIVFKNSCDVIVSKDDIRAAAGER